MNPGVLNIGDPRWDTHGNQSDCFVLFSKEQRKIRALGFVDVEEEERICGGQEEAVLKHLLTG